MIHGAHDNRPATDEEVLSQIREVSKDGPAEKLAAAFIRGLKDGTFDQHALPETPRISTETVAFGLLMRTLGELGLGQMPSEGAAVLLYDPADGPGAEQAMGVLEVDLGPTPNNLTAQALIGQATEWGAPLHRGLRAVILTPCELKVSSDGNDVSGFAATLFAYRDSDGTIKHSQYRAKIERKNGEWAAHEATVEPEDDSQFFVQTMRAMMEINALIRPVHPKLKFKG
jgi:hypothetical protein